MIQKNSSAWNPLAISYKYYYDSVTVSKELQYFKIKDQKQLEKYVCYYHDDVNCNVCFENVVDNKIIVFRDQWFWDLNEAHKFVEATKNELKSLAIEEINDLVLTIWPLNGGENDHFDGIIFSSKENPCLVYMYSAWKYAKIFGLGKIKNTKIIKPFNFINNHYFNLFSYVTTKQVEMMKNEIEAKIALILKIPVGERTPEQVKLLEKCKKIGINL